MDYFRILGVKPTTTWEEVRRRYRTLAQKHHPDRNPGDPEAAARFRLVVEAYEALQSAWSARSRTGAGDENFQTPRFTHKEELFAEFFGISWTHQPLSRSAGADFRYDLEIPLAAAVKGMETVIAVDHHPQCRHCRGTGLALGGRYQPCPACQGRGRRYGGPGLLRFGPICEPCRGRGRVPAQACPQCEGRGYCQETRKYRLQIPPGTRDGARMRLRGEGGEGFADGPPGNLQVVIHVAPDDFFTLVGNDLHCQVKVSFALAALGGTVRVPTLWGERDMQLPQGTQSGWTFRFPGAGAPGGPDLPPGDQLNEVVVMAPVDLSPRQRELLQEWVRLAPNQFERVGHE